METNFGSEGTYYRGHRISEQGVPVLSCSYYNSNFGHTAPSSLSREEAHGKYITMPHLSWPALRAFGSCMEDAVLHPGAGKNGIPRIIEIPVGCDCVSFADTTAAANDDYSFEDDDMGDVTCVIKRVQTEDTDTIQSDEDTTEEQRPKYGQEEEEEEEIGEEEGVSIAIMMNEEKRRRTPITKNGNALSMDFELASDMMEEQPMSSGRLSSLPPANQSFWSIPVEMRPPTMAEF